MKGAASNPNFKNFESSHLVHRYSFAIMETACNIWIMWHDNYKSDLLSRIKLRSIERDNGCIEYGIGKLVHRYGLISVTIDGRRKCVPAHRVMWMATNDRLDLPRDIIVRHKCDNPRCVNIDHLEIGAHVDNKRDCIDRGRYGKRYRIHTRFLVHDDAKILAIRGEPEGMKQRDIAKKHGVSIGYVCKIRNGKAKTLVK